MPPAPVEERRRHKRYPLAAGIHFQHGPSQQEFPARTADISDGGLLMKVPATAPLQVGHPLTVHLSEVPGTGWEHYRGEPTPATVVRVDRSTLLNSGHLTVGVRFATRA